MKFAKYLQDEAVPEWRKAYINYKQGKKYLKAIERALDLLEAEALASDINRIPAHLLESIHFEGRDIAPDQVPSPFPYDPQQPFSTSPPLSLSQSGTIDPPAPAEASSTNAATPILSRSRGHARNYSAIIISPPTTRSTMSTPTTSSNPYGSSSAIDEDRSGLGGSTIYETSPDIAASPERNPRAIPVTKASTSSQFGQSARSHSTHILKSISRRFTIISPSEPPLRTRAIQVDDNSIDNVLGQLLPEERVFFQFLDTQLQMVNNFYREKELEAVTKLKVIKQQLYVANEWKRRYHDKMAKAEAEHGWYAAEWSKVRKGLDNFIRADSAITEDVTMAPSKRHLQLPTNKIYASSAGGYGPTLDPEQGLRHRDLRGVDSPPGSSFHSRKLGPSAANDDLAYQEELVLQEEEHRRQRLNHKVARTRIKAALYEFYRSLEMIKNYKVLNHTGFAKILKKFDKTAGWKSSKSYMNSKLRPAYFMISSTVEDLIKETEDVFIDTFEKGHRRRGMAKLRIPDSKSQTHHLTSTRIGLYLGLALPLMFQALQSAFSSDMPAEIPYWDSLLLIYAGLFLTILFSCLFGVNMYVWAKSRINYKFIFEFDPRDNLDFHEYFELPIFLMLLLTLAVYLDFGSKLTAHVATAYWPLILMAISGVILFCPLPIAHFTARRWFISSIGRILASGYYRVEFRDFFLADEMNSLSYSIEQFEFALCAYSQQWNDLANTCSTSHMWITPFVTALPAWFRFLQCLRRYQDTLEWFPHLLNAGKYTASLFNLFVYFSYRHYGGTQLKVAWIFVSFLTSIYTFTWDIYMDWGLFRFGKHGGGAYGHPFLRQELVYSRTWVYYMAILLDFVGRFSWTIRLIPMNVNVMLLSFSLALLEVLRRWQWNFFRLENEHLNNCGQFRAIKDIPLPFHIRVEGETDDEEEEEDEEQQTEDRRDYEPHELLEVHDMQTPDDSDRGFSGFSSSHIPSSPSQKAGIVRSSSSNSNFARYSNGNHAHGLSNIGGGDRKMDSSRGSVHSTSSQGAQRPPPKATPRMGMGRKSFSQSYVYGAGAGIGIDNGHGIGPGSPSSSSRNLSSTNDQAVSSYPFVVARSNSFVASAVAEAGFKDAQLEALESETGNNNSKFYDRRDFDSKIIDTDSELWRTRGRSMTGSSSLHGLQTLSLGGGSNGVLEERGRPAGDERRPRSQVMSRRKMSVGTWMRSTIFADSKSSESDEDDEDDTV